MNKSVEEIGGWFNYRNTFDFLLDNTPVDGVFAECGAWLGQSSAYLCDKNAALNKNIKVYIIDSWKGAYNELDGAQALAKNTDIYPIFLENMGSRIFTPIRALSTDAVKMFDDQSLDTIFIDMCHAYECVKEDLEIWYPKLKPGGYMAGHDYGWLSVSQAVNEKFKNVRRDEDCWIVHNIEGVLNV